MAGESVISPLNAKILGNQKSNNMLEE